MATITVQKQIERSQRKKTVLKRWLDRYVICGTINHHLVRPRFIRFIDVTAKMNHPPNRLAEYEFICDRCGDYQKVWKEIYD